MNVRCFSQQPSQDTSVVVEVGCAFSRQYITSYLCCNAFVCLNIANGESTVHKVGALAFQSPVYLHVHLLQLGVNFALLSLSFPGVLCPAAPCC